MNQGNWLYKAEKLLKKFKKAGKKLDKFDDLEKLALEYRNELGEIMLGGVVGDKGTGKDKPIPEINTDENKPKYKGIKKKD